MAAMVGTTLVACGGGGGGGGGNDIVDQVLDQALDFEGRFKTEDGLVIEIDKETALGKVLAFGESVLGTNTDVVRVGDIVIRNVVKDGEGRYSAEVFIPTIGPNDSVSGGGFQKVAVTYDGSKLIFDAPADAAYSGELVTSNEPPAKPDTPDTPDTPGEPDTPAPGAVLSMNGEPCTLSIPGVNLVGTYENTAEASGRPATILGGDGKGTQEVYGVPDPQYSYPIHWCIRSDAAGRPIVDAEGAGGVAYRLVVKYGRPYQGLDYDAFQLVVQKPPGNQIFILGERAKAQ
jgi:hypothetical protein